VIESHHRARPLAGTGVPRTNSAVSLIFDMCVSGCLVQPVPGSQGIKRIPIPTSRDNAGTTRVPDLFGNRRNPAVPGKGGNRWSNRASTLETREFSHLSRIEATFRCKICGDALGETADIAISDIWPGGGPSGEDAGFNGFIARTERGAGLLRRATDAGALTLVGDMGFRDFDVVQPHQVRKKQAITSRLAALRDAGFPTTEYRGLRLDEAASTALPEYRQENYEGMRRQLAKRRPTQPD
jgi:hypothetical protein